MKKFIIGGLVWMLSSFVYAAEGDHGKAVAECERLGGQNFQEVDAFSGESEVSCTFAPAVTCGQLQLLQNTCVVSGDEVKARNLCSDLKGVAKGESADIESCSFGDFGVCTRADLLAGNCRISGELGATRFGDIIGNVYEAAIRYVESQGIVEGYEDGNYRPNVFINRAEFTKIVVAALYDEEVYGSFGTEGCFPDVAANEWYTKYVCYAKNVGIVKGNGDGTFKPGHLINYVEGLKIVLEAYGKELGAEGVTWYSKYAFYGMMNDLSLAFVLSPENVLTRGQMAELIYWVSNL